MLCGGKRYLHYMRPAGKHFCKATEDELRSFREKIQPLTDKATRFVGDKDKRFYERQFDEIMKLAVKVWPVYKKDVKLTRQKIKLYMKHRELKPELGVGDWRRYPVDILRTILQAHLTLVDHCMKVIDRNKAHADKRKDGGGDVKSGVSARLPRAGSAK